MSAMENTMPFVPAGFAVNMADLAEEWFDDAQRGTVRWRTLVDGGRLPTTGMVAGVATFGPGGTLNAHRHTAPEFYFGLSGSAIVTIDGVDWTLEPGVAVYLPGDVEHATVAGADGASFLYVFPVDRFDDVEYRFSHLQAANADFAPGDEDWGT